MYRIIALTLVLLLTACASKNVGIEAYSNKSAQQIYQEGKTNLAKGRFRNATQDFEALDAMFPFSPYSERALLESIYAYYKNDDLPSTLAAADRFIHLYPRSTRVDYAYYMRGIAQQNINKSWIYKVVDLDPSMRDLSGYRDAFNTYKALVHSFPHSQYACDARKRMIYIRDVLAKHEYEVADFYFHRRAYVAAANRASEVVKHYEGASEVKPALAMMIKSYRALGKNDMANDAQRVYQQSYGRSAS